MATIVRLTPERLREELEALEEKHGMSSDTFFTKYHAGQTGDSQDEMHWAWLCGMAIRRGVLKLSHVCR